MGIQYEFNSFWCAEDLHRILFVPVVILTFPVLFFKVTVYRLMIDQHFCMVRFISPPAALAWQGKWQKNIYCVSVYMWTLPVYVLGPLLCLFEKMGILRKCNRKI